MLKYEIRAFPGNGGDTKEGKSWEGVKAGPGAEVLAVPAAMPSSPFPQSLGFVWLLTPASCGMWLSG